MQDAAARGTRGGDAGRALGALLEAHAAYRSSTLNLVASENVLSPAVRAALSTDLLGRYADYPGRDPSKRRYRGNRYIAEIEALAVRLAAERFGARFVELRAIAGHLAGIAIVMGLCRPGDVVFEVGREGGGHREAGRLVVAPLASLDVEYLPFDAQAFNVDADAAVRRIEERRPRLVILGSSNFLYPHPVRAIADAVHRVPDAVLAYDASHVLGFLAAGRFQDPLGEGADIVFGSTHKTFPGPQGGIIFSNDDALMDRVSEALVPALVTNHHPFRMPGMVVALEEMATWGEAYAEAIVANARALARALVARGVPVVEAGGRPTDSHTILLRVSAFGTGDAVSARLETAGIMSTGAFLPESLGREGIRMGSQEVTRLGATPQTMEWAAELIAAVVTGSRQPEEVHPDVAELAGTLGPIRFA